MRRICLLLLAISLLSVSRVSAADLSVALEQPKSPTNQNNFDINFVALDIQDRVITVKCFKKGPSDGDFSQFGPDMALTAGGNTGNCHIDSSLLNIEGSYQFKVNGTADSESVDSSVVSVEYRVGGAGTPASYNKEKVDCTYKIKFRTAADEGKTVKVEIYRSENLSFDTNSDSRVGSISIGSDTEGSFENTVPECGKDYFYAIRAFDNAGNGSGVIGDSVIKTVINYVTIVPTGTGAIPVVAGGVSEGQVLGEETPTGAEASPGAAEEAGQIGGAAVQANKLFNKNTIILIVVLAAALLVIVFLRKRSVK